tara:strand:+ start:5544 stop:5846 length:303 start_codon:yes stop_codon:yes gene_type:complete
MNKLMTLFAVITFGSLGYLGYKSHVTHKMVAENRSMLMDGFQNLAEVEMMMEGFVEMAPREMESISRKVAREEVLAGFQQFAENFRNLSNEKESLQPTED